MHIMNYYTIDFSFSSNSIQKVKVIMEIHYTESDILGVYLY